MVSGYTRQSSAEIVDAAVIYASSHNAEYNQIAAAFSEISGHTHDGSVGGGKPLGTAGLGALTTTSAGIIVANGSDDFVVRTLTGPAAGITVTNGSGVSGNPTLALANDLAALEAMSGTGLVARTASETYTQRTITAGSNISVMDGDGVAGNPTIALTGIGSTIQAYDAGLAALAAFNTNGILVQTADNTFAGRTLTGTTNRITVTNGDGVSGNPTVDIASTYAGQATITTLGTIATGTWQGTLIGSTYGGTGVNNGSNTITLGGNIATAAAFTTSGANALTLTTTGATNVTLPTSGTLLTTASAAATYLPLAGGALTGTLTSNSNIDTTGTRITTTGKVHIGNSTTPTQVLELTATDNPRMQFTDTGNFSGTFGIVGSTALSINHGTTEVMRWDSAFNVGIGGAANANAILDVQSTTKAFRPPVMTTAQKNAISSPQAGFIVHDTNLTRPAWYNGSVWEYAPFGKRFTSTDQTITAAGSLTLAHSLGVRPFLVQAWLKCTTAELGYSIGDLVPTPINICATTGSSQGVVVVPDATNLNIRFGSGGLIVLRKDTGAGAGITAGNWSIYFEAFA